MVSHWLLLFILTVVPFGIGIWLLVIRGKMQTTASQVFALFGAAFAILTGSLYAASVSPQVWATHLENQWKSKNPKTEAELESHLSLYTKRVLKPGEYLASEYVKMSPEERLVRYSILGAPLDVIYNAKDEIVVIYTRYE